MKVVEFEGVYWDEFFLFCLYCLNKYFSSLQNLGSFTLDELSCAVISSCKLFLLLRYFKQILNSWINLLRVPYNKIL